MAGKPDKYFEIEDFLHEHTKQFNEDNVYFNVVIFGDKGVGKKTLRNFKPLLQKKGLQMNVFIKAELEHMAMINVEMPDYRPTGYTTSREKWLKIQLTLLDVKEGFQAKKNHSGHMDIYLFDLTKKSSYMNLEKLSAGNQSVPAILIGNKVDLVQERAVGKKDISNLYKKLNCSHYGEISALTEQGVMEEVWLQILRVRSDWMHKRMPVPIQDNREIEERDLREEMREQELLRIYPHFRNPENCDETCNCRERLEIETSLCLENGWN